MPDMPGNATPNEPKDTLYAAATGVHVEQTRILVPIAEIGFAVAPPLLRIACEHGTEKTNRRCAPAS